MFVLMSKSAAAAKAPSATISAHSSSRTQTACDACRIRKSKCDGHSPCGRCRARKLVCTSSRRFAKATGPVTEEHVAMLQEQQRRLARAISTMADVIKRAESRGFSEEPDTHNAQELSSYELAEILQKFAPESETSEPATSPVHQTPLQSKKRKVDEGETSSPDEQQAQDLVMEDSWPTPPNSHGINPFQQLMSTVQQPRNGNDTMGPSAFQPTTMAGFDPQQPQVMPVPGPQDSLVASPRGASTLQFDNSQLATFADLVDWDASLQYFLDQYNGDEPEWTSA